MRDPRTFQSLVKGVRNHLTQANDKIEQFLQFYEQALNFMHLRNILPKNQFTKKRITLIGRDLALSIYLAMCNMYEEAQFLLRQILDLAYVILYAANHVLELRDLEAGKIDQIANVRKEINKKLPSELKEKLKSHYRKLSCVVHGTVKDILSQVRTVEESWENPSKLGHWKNDFNLTLEYSACIFRCWMPDQYALLDVSKRVSLENSFPTLKTLETN